MSCAGSSANDLFTVVFEQVMTDTAHYADVLLPATTFLEGYDIARATAHRSAAGKTGDRSRGEARSNAEVFGELLGDCSTA